jgi:osmoprotectant transport system permease protein
MVLTIFAAWFVASTTSAQVIRVGAKHFNEGYILSEITAQLLEASGFKVERKYNLGGTMVCFTALQHDAIDVYPEYSGTISAEILKAERNLNLSEIRERMHEQYHVALSEPFGFSNTYALVMRKDSLGKSIKNISQLALHADVRVGVSYEFLKRQDGWGSLSRAYLLKNEAAGLEHGLAYQALLQGKIDVTDAYATDGEISKYNLQLLEDDKHFFPDYEALCLYRDDLPPQAQQLLNKLGHTLNEEEMQKMNAEALFGHKSFSAIASSFLREKRLVSLAREEDDVVSDLLMKTLRHLELTFLALFLALIVALPLGIALYWHPAVANPVLYITGLFQTIPSIALLAMLIPLTGIGITPAIVALFLYALLPILRNTTTGLRSVDPLYTKVARGMGMSNWQVMRFVELPLALPTVIAGIRTAVVINIGTATLAAFIGAGGLGEYIVTGLALNNAQLILRGAVPTALLALIFELLFEVMERRVSRRG